VQIGAIMVAKAFGRHERTEPPGRPARVISGKYSDFLEMKAQREEMEMASERKKQSILRMEIEWAKRGCRARSTKQRARLDRLEEIRKLKTEYGKQLKGEKEMPHREKS